MGRWVTLLSPALASALALSAEPRAQADATAQAPKAAATEARASPAESGATAKTKTSTKSKGATPWSRARAPSAGAAASIGGYSSGCVNGARELPLSSPTHAVMKPERHRHFGHPALIDFVASLATAAHGRGLEKLAVGDLGQPRGGPAPSGHASHQSGLDVDLWFSKASDPPAQHSMVDLEAKTVNARFGRRAITLLELSAKDARVARIFVHAAIKKRVCEVARGDRSWLRKLRPWYGHHEHFHVRLACPKGSPECKAQAPVPAGDGCGGVDWWLSDKTKSGRKSGVTKYAKRIRSKPKLPTSCQRLVTPIADPP